MLLRIDRRQAGVVVLAGVEPRAGVGDLVRLPGGAVPARVMEAVIEAALAAREAAAVFLHREDHARPLVGVEFQIGHPGDVVGSP